MGFNFTQFFQKEEPVIIQGNAAAAITAAAAVVKDTMGTGHHDEHDHYQWDLTSMDSAEMLSLRTLVFLAKVCALQPAIVYCTSPSWQPWCMPRGKGRGIGLTWTKHARCVNVSVQPVFSACL